MTMAQSLLQQARMRYSPKLPSTLVHPKASFVGKTRGITPKPVDPDIAEMFLHISQQRPLSIIQRKIRDRLPLRIGVVFSGGQAAGGHNVIAGLFDAMKKLNKTSKLIAFLDGPGGIIENKFIEITASKLARYRNQGGFDLIGSGRTKIEKPEQLKATDKTVQALELDGLVIIGGDDSNTNAAVLAERFAANGCKTCVIGVPKTIDGDLKNDDIEISFGFDTACKVYSETLGNLMRDALSAKKYYFFVKLMGRSASHIALECALQTHPNLTLIGEEVAAAQITLNELVGRIADLICDRARLHKNYGVIVIPEGLIEFIPEVNTLIKELNVQLSEGKSNTKAIEALSPKALSCFTSLTKEIQDQLLLARDAHGNVQVSKIETERMLIEMVERELKVRANAGIYVGVFSPQPLFCGYEGRSCLPSNFDSQYCYALGYTSALLIDAKANGYICTIKNLAQPVNEWQAGGYPLAAMMTLEQRHGASKPVIKKALVDLSGKPYALLKKNATEWALNDEYKCPGPMQFFGPPQLTDTITKTLKLETSKKKKN